MFDACEDVVCAITRNGEPDSCISYIHQHASVGDDVFETEAIASHKIKLTLNLHELTVDGLGLGFSIYSSYPLK